MKIRTLIVFATTEIHNTLVLNTKICASLCKTSYVPYVVKKKSNSKNKQCEKPDS
jgi:hypothetical protein